MQICLADPLTCSIDFHNWIDPIMEGWNNAQALLDSWLDAYQRLT
jgi:hypothetical protein